MEELSKQTRIDAELLRLRKYFYADTFDRQTRELELLESLIENAAFMRITLEDLQEIINRDGPVEEYQNGENQKGMKQSAALQSYNVIMKNYSAIMKQLSNLLYSFPVVRIEPTKEDKKKKKKQKLVFSCPGDAMREYYRQRADNKDIEPYFEWAKNNNVKIG